ncbi:MAG: hypothetical protein G8D28_08885 [gamma proteobacterium symbiont of Phacoides pectinatus]
MHKRGTPLALLLLCTLTGVPSWAPAQEARPGASQRPPAGGGHQMHQRGPKQFSLANAAGARATLWKPDLSRIPLAIENGTLTLKGTGVDNYHALVIEQNWGYLVESIISYHYMRGKPSGRSTTELTAARKTRLEIVPQPVPREHHRYESGERWGFQVRFDGRPMAAQALTLETAHGSTLTASVTIRDASTLPFPTTFPASSGESATAPWRRSPSVPDTRRRAPTISAICKANTAPTPGTGAPWAWVWRWPASALSPAAC